MQRQHVGGSVASVSAAEEDCVGRRVGRAGRGRDGAFLVERVWRPRDEEGSKAAAATRQGRQQQPCGKEGSGSHAARKAEAAARQGRQRRPRGKEGSSGAATKVVAARQGRQRHRNNGSANQKVQVRSGGNAYQHAPEGVAGDALP
jgi:hypothetical protein